MSIYLPVLFAIIGLIVYLAATHPKIQEAGRLMFFSGLFVFLFQVGNHSVNLLGK